VGGLRYSAVVGLRHIALSQNDEPVVIDIKVVISRCNTIRVSLAQPHLRVDPRHAHTTSVDECGSVAAW